MMMMMMKIKTYEKKSLIRSAGTNPLNHSPYVNLDTKIKVICEPDVVVRTLAPEDWALVLVCSKVTGGGEERKGVIHGAMPGSE